MKEQKTNNIDTYQAKYKYKHENFHYLLKWFMSTFPIRRLNRCWTGLKHENTGITSLGRRKKSKNIDEDIFQLTNSKNELKLKLCIFRLPTKNFDKTVEQRKYFNFLVSVCFLSIRSIWSALVFFFKLLQSFEQFATSNLLWVICALWAIGIL